MSSLRLLLRRQDAHSWLLASAGLLLAATLIVDLLLHQHMQQRWLIWTLLVIALIGSAISFAAGRRVPRALGIFGVVLFFGAHAYFLSLADDPQSVVSSLQQLPIVALYLGWFVRPLLAVPIALAGVLTFCAVMLSNPLFWPGGLIGFPVAVNGLLGLVLCYAAGLYLWRRAVRNESVDPLTGALTRARFEERALHCARRARAPLSIVAIDFDGLKRMNDERGHAAGDEALESTVAVWLREMRAGDAVGRIGGDEFALLLPGTDSASAARIAERLLEVSPHRWSWGATQYESGEDIAQFWKRADRLLYEHKRKQRSRDG
ncbi:GGDEF domain-containing protein [Leucobacter sp. USHLN153]|uniref:GGDEF domain-containing protein n=1 Tax=Leucobacter sp. USHLN153 TaxID=3081268 RepID=UPI0030197377